jgi:potassium channel subfamily K
MSVAETYVTDVAAAVADGVQSLPAKIKKKIRLHWRLLTACLFMVTLGVVMGMVFEDWEFLTSLYVIVQIVTTIGYGDVTVQTDWMKLFMAFYVLASLLVVANFFNLIFDVVIESNVQSIRSRLRQVEIGALADIHNDEEAQKEWGMANRAGSAAVLLVVAISTGTLFFRFAERCTCSYGNTQEDFGLQQCDDTSYDTCVATGGLQMSWASAFYMSVITVTTVGFGDHSPKSRVGRVIGIIWMLLGVAVTAYFVKALSDVLAWEDEKIEFEGAQNINEEIFHQMDKDGNGHLSKDEYALYVLVKHNLVSKDILEDIYAKYDSMDSDGQGQLTYHMLRKGAPEIRKRKRSAVAAAELRAEPPPAGSSPKSPPAGSSPKSPPTSWAV